jgi:hypothetical protein
VAVTEGGAPVARRPSRQDTSRPLAARECPVEAPAMTTARRRTAIHEAAHAVVGYALGWRIRTVVATPGGGRLGFCEHHRREDLSPMALAVDDVTIIAAGWIGEMLEPMSGYFAPVDDDEAAIARAVDEALEALPPDDGGFVFAMLTDTGPNVGTDETRQEAIALAVVAEESAVEERALFLAFCRARATRFVCAHVPAILALAEELLRRPILDGPAAEAIIRGDTPERP